MPDVSDRLPSRRDRHAPTRMLASLAVSLLAVNATFLLWPDPALGPDLQVTPPAREMVVMEMIEPTEQPPPPANLPPPPPPPPSDAELPPEEVPDEVVIEEIDLDLPTPPRPEPRRPTARRPAPPAPVAPPPPAPSAPPPASDRIVERPERSPTTVGQPLPVYPRDASTRDFRGRARVKVLVNQGGRATEVEIVERLVLDGDRETPVRSFPPEFDRAFLEAARRAVFRPARDAGERVRAYAIITLTMDPG